MALRADRQGSPFFAAYCILLAEKAKGWKNPLYSRQAAAYNGISLEENALAINQIAID